MSIASKLSLVAAFAAALAATSAEAAVQGFSIALTDMTFERGSDLSAEAAAFGTSPNVVPAIPLSNNGSYSETLTGDYAVTDTLPPSDQSVFWQTFTQISLNGQPFFTGNEIVGPESQDDIWSAVLNVTGLNKAQLAVLKAILVNHNVLNSGGEFDYAYNFAPGDRTVGTFAVGSDKNLTSTEDFGAYVDPFATPAFDSVSVPDGPNVWSLTFSATVTTIPEAPTWLMLMAGGAGVLVIRGLGRRPRMAGEVSA